ncbi:type II toxin-antitoxin system Phd/YefM family antitoxin [bacterium]|nr:type II toxin-antitoxin system Phd/YefM family antitoxin [bacterium]
MKRITLSGDIVQVEVFKTGLSRYLKSINKTGRHIIITQNGRPAGVLLSPAQYGDLMYRDSFIESVNRGLADVESGRVFSTEQVIQKLKAARAKDPSNA